MYRHLIGCSVSVNDTLISWILRHFPGNKIKILFICIFTKSGDVALILISTIQEFPALNQRNNFKKLNISSFNWKKNIFEGTLYTPDIGLAWHQTIPDCLAKEKNMEEDWSRSFPGESNSLSSPLSRTITLTNSKQVIFLAWYDNFTPTQKLLILIFLKPDVLYFKYFRLWIIIYD